MPSQQITLYAYMNIDNPMVAWEVAIGRVRSACDNTRDEFGISLWQYGLLSKYSRCGFDRRFLNELQLESLRQKAFPDQVSRLKGVYFFESAKDACVALDRWDIKGRQREYICEVQFSANNITRVDSEWITSFLQSEGVDWMPGYWRGETLGIAPLTEVLASGSGVIHDGSFRAKAYKKVMEISPYSTFLLAAASVGFAQLGLKNIARTVPALISRDGQVEGGFYINLSELNENEGEIVSLVNEAMACNEFPTVILPSDPEAIFHLPDMRSSVFKLGAGEAFSLFGQVHANSVDK